MTPEHRLDQLEPLMADSLQKIDRLIEGQGQLTDLVTQTKAELDQVKETGEQTKAELAQVKKTGEFTANGLANLTVSTHNGLANLTISTQKQFDELKAGQEAIMNYLREKLP